jgi:hypothetical protein
MRVQLKQCAPSLCESNLGMDHRSDSVSIRRCMPLASRAKLLLNVFPQLALWAIDMPSAVPTG